MITTINIHKILYTSSDKKVFQNNFLFWFFLKLYFSIYYGFNIFYVIYGFLLWSFWEYVYHRFMMHGLKNTTYYNKLHGYHHQYPNKLSHIPVFQYILISPLFFITSYYLNPSVVYSYSVGHLLGLYCFEKMHYIIHNDLDKTHIYTKYHMYHHHNSNTTYCFTCPCFDIICYTFPTKKFSYNIIALLPIPYIGFLGVKEIKND
jgi:hypothetical protein